MSYMNQILQEIIGDAEKVKAVLAAVKSNDTRKRYLKTDKGKAARQRANMKYYTSTKSTINSDEIYDHFRNWCTTQKDEEVKVSLNELWREFSKVNKITRKLYASQLMNRIPESLTFFEDDKVHFSRLINLTNSKYLTNLY